MHNSEACNLAFEEWSKPLPKIPGMRGSFQGGWQACERYMQSQSGSVERAKPISKGDETHKTGEREANDD